FAAGMQSFAEGMQAQPQSQSSGYSSGYGSGLELSPRPARAASIDTCTSDFSCGVGRRCVKPNFSTSGTCMNVVNQVGVQQFTTMPSLDSVGPKMPVSTDCHFDTDCPVLFRCDARSGACLKR